MDMRLQRAKRWHNAPSCDHETERNKPPDTVGEVRSAWASGGVGSVSALKAAHVAAVAAAPASVVHGSGGGVEAQGDAWDHSPKLWMPLLPFKRNQDHRHHFPRQQRKVTNWPAYDASLRQRGSLTVWFTDEAIAAWAAEPRATRGGQAQYSPLAILTALTLRTVFRLA